MTLNRAAQLCFLGIAIAAVGNAYLLNQGELVRLAVIAAGLVAYHRIHRREVPLGEPGWPRLSASILALVFVFLFVQFDPAFSGMSRSIQYGYVNWFAGMASVLAVLAFAATLADTRRRKMAGSLVSRFSTWDWSVIAACAIGLILVAANYLTVEVNTERAHFACAKLVLCAMLYVSVIGAYDLSSSSLQKAGDRQSSPTIWRVLALAALAILLIGFGKSIYAQFLQEEGKELLTKKLYADARPHFESALMLSGRQSENSQMGLAETLLGLGETREAQVIIRAARGLYVGSETLEKRIGDAYRRTGHLARAVYEYRTLGNRIGELHVFNELAAAYLGDGQFRELTELIKRQRLAPTIESLSSEDRVRLALCLMEVGEYDSARREIEASVSDDRSHWIVEYGEGVLASRTQDWDSSRESLQRAIELDPTQLEPRIELASTFIELGQYDSARVQAEYVLEREPHRIIALGQLASVFEARSDLDRVKDIVSRMSVRISQWQGPQGGGLGAAGSCWYDLELYPGQFSISITARSTPAVGVWPLMIVSMGQEKVASVTVDRDDVYTFQTKVTSSGTHRLDVFFPNDSSADQPGDRNLYVDSATLQYLGIARQP